MAINKGIFPGCGHDPRCKASDRNGNPVGHSHPDRVAGVLVDSQGFPLGRCGAAFARMGVASPTEDMSVGRRVRLPSLVFASLSCQALVWPHGNCDVPALAKQVMNKYGLVNLSRHKPDLVDSDYIENELIDTTPFDGRAHNSPMPSGWFKAASGFTRVFRQHWQLKRAAHWWSTPQLYLKDGVHLVISGATWFFNETADFETRVAVGVATSGRLEQGQWRYREDLEKTHMTVARAAVGEIFEALTTVKPHSFSIIQRRLLAAAHGKVADPLDVMPASGKSDDEMAFDIRDGSLD